MLISNGGTDDLFPPDEAIRFYNRTRTTHPGTPIALIFTDHGHQRGQNKGPDGTFRNRETHAWFDFYVKGVGPQPFLGVQTLTQTCSGPSGGATGDFDDPDTDLPFQASSWATLAPGEVRVESAAQQVIASAVPSDGPVGQAFDPIAGGGACATASGADQTGAATYRSDPVPAGGFTLMGSATIVADILSPGPTSQLAARLLDVDPVSGDETLVARGLYRPEISTLTASCQVFQLHPNGWRFAAGHIAKLELLPADQPYGRNSNGQAPITVSNLRLRLPVIESPGGVVQPPSAKVLPAGYALAVDFPPDIDPGCAVTPTTTSTTGATTSTTGGSTSSTTAASTTTTTLPPGYPLNVTTARLRAERSPGAANGSVRVQGDFVVPPAFSFPPSFTVRIQDGLNLDRAHTFETCRTLASGRILCRESASDGRFRASFRRFRRNPGAIAFMVSFDRQAISAPFAAPVRVILTHNSAVLRSDTISGCRLVPAGMICREF